MLTVDMANVGMVTITTVVMDLLVDTMFEHNLWTWTKHMYFECNFGHNLLNLANYSKQSLGYIL